MISRGLSVAALHSRICQKEDCAEQRHVLMIILPSIRYYRLMNDSVMAGTESAQSLINHHSRPSILRLSHHHRQVIIPGRNNE